MSTKEIEFEDCFPTSFRDLGNGYTKAFVTFIDILGFRDIIQNEPPDIVNQKLDAMSLFSSLPQMRAAEHTEDLALPIVIQFSDSIIRIQPASGEDELSIARGYFGELSSLTLMQGNLVCNGILIRGGLTYGDVCVREGRVFGPAFNRAYAIESSLARYPRILIDEFLTLNNGDNPIVSQVGSASWTQMQSDIFEYLDRAEDGQWILDYLPHLFQAERSNNISCKDVLFAHRDSIVELLKKSMKSGKEEPKAKIRWMANYHNKIINRSFSKLRDDSDKTQDSLIIDLN
ncbi:hypothetical protein ACGLWX_17470 [Halomonas sp. HMF6819]|uniref:hypothetical protein n=1 Tax=Halomonas sp. HMF6819 TaxID=3373085 RepID=UPI0037879DCC